MRRPTWLSWTVVVPLLAVAVTVIEVALIVTLMISGGPGSASLARDTVFAALMLTTTGIVGLPLLVGGRTRLRGGVHLVLLAAFLFLAVNP